MNLPITQLSCGQLPPMSRVLMIRFHTGNELYAQTRRFKYLEVENDQTVRKEADLLTVLEEDSSKAVRDFISGWIYQYLQTSSIAHAVAFRQQYNGVVPRDRLYSAGAVVLDYRGNQKHPAFHFLPMIEGLIMQDTGIYMNGWTVLGTATKQLTVSQFLRPHSRRQPPGNKQAS